LSEAAFLEQVKLNQGIIYKLVGLYAQDAEEKKDFYQEILLQAWKSWPAYRGDAKFSTWLYRICLNTIFTLKRKKHPVDYKDSLEPLSMETPNLMQQQEEAVRLRRAIHELSEIDRAIISMHLDGYENREISDMTGISDNGVAVKLHRIKKQLANLLKP